MDRKGGFGQCTVYHRPSQVQIWNPIQIQIIPQHPTHCLRRRTLLGQLEFRNFLMTSISCGVRGHRPGDILSPYAFTFSTLGVLA
ncbi:hypothetical protein ACKS0A_08044 [Histoplasma ohiense]